MAEVWFRNPWNYVRELVECNTALIAWDRGTLVKRQINPEKFIQLYYGKHAPYRMLLIGDQGTMELIPGRGIDNPAAVYPTWKATESLELLEEVMAHPMGDDPDCYEADLPVDERPVEGQEHRVVVTDLPNMVHGAGRALLKKLKELQEDYPDCILHLHGMYSFRLMFGMGFRSADYDPRTGASKGKVMIPAGKEMVAEKTIACPQWVTLLGFNVVDLKQPKNRCMYNIKSAMWAAEHYMENIKFKSTGDVPVIPTTKTQDPATTQSHMSRPLPVVSGDKQICNTCSLQNGCKYFRAGAVCSVPGAEPAGLAKMFKTRDSDTIIDGLGTVLQLQAHRLERGARDEEEYGELDPEVTKIADQLFTNGVKLAKLIDPALAKPNVVVNVGSTQAAVAASTPNQVMGAIVRELESRGVPRDKITADMVQNLLIEMGQKEAGGTAGAIESRVVANGS